MGALSYMYSVIREVYFMVESENYQNVGSFDSI